jgi:hypothetical protein
MDMALVKDVVHFREEMDNVRAALDRAFAPGGDTRLGMLLGGIWRDLANFFSHSRVQ